MFGIIHLTNSLTLTHSHFLYHILSHSLTHSLSFTSLPLSLLITPTVYIAHPLYHSLNNSPTFPHHRSQSLTLTFTHSVNLTHSNQHLSQPTPHSLPLESLTYYLSDPLLLTPIVTYSLTHYHNSPLHVSTSRVDVAITPPFRQSLRSNYHCPCYCPTPFPPRKQT